VGACYGMTTTFADVMDYVELTPREKDIISMAITYSYRHSQERDCMEPEECARIIFKNLKISATAAQIDEIVEHKHPGVD
jgi:hypothetical protein